MLHRPRLSAGMSRGERIHLFSMIGAGMILALLMVRLRDADMARVIDQTFGPLFQDPNAKAAAAKMVPSESNADATSVTAKVSNADTTSNTDANTVSGTDVSNVAGDPFSTPIWETKLLPNSVPDDTDAAEVDAFRRDSGAISDRAYENTSYEMPVYQRLVRWTAAQTYTQMNQRATEVEYQELLQHPSKYRGRLIRLVIDARLVRSCAATDWNHDPELPLAEIWGPLPNTGVRLVTAITVGVPTELPLGDISQRVEFVGYFYKVQAYESRQSNEGEARLAPALIGRVKILDVTPPRATTTDYTALWGTIVVFGLIGLVSWMIARRRRLVVTPTSAAIVTQHVENWLDRPTDSDSESKNSKNMSDVTKSETNAPKS